MLGSWDIPGLRLKSPSSPPGISSWIFILFYCRFSHRIIILLLLNSFDDYRCDCQERVGSERDLPLLASQPHLNLINHGRRRRRGRSNWIVGGKGLRWDEEQEFQERRRMERRTRVAMNWWRSNFCKEFHKSHLSKDGVVKELNECEVPAVPLKVKFDILYHFLMSYSFVHLYL